MNTPSYFEIQVDDVNRARNFYADVFGWRFKKAAGLPDYWRIETDGLRGGLLQRPAKTPPPEHGTNAYVCSMEVKHFDKVAGKITSRGGKVALRKFAVRGVLLAGLFPRSRRQHLRHLSARPKGEVVISSLCTLMLGSSDKHQRT